MEDIFWVRAGARVVRVAGGALKGVTGLWLAGWAKLFKVVLSRIQCRPRCMRVLMEIDTRFYGRVCEIRWGSFLLESRF